jgi:hypothetical protein
MSVSKFAVTVSDGDVPLFDKDFRTRKAAAEYVAALITGSRIKYLRIEIGVQRAAG